jgi:hypothetical protein
MKQMTWAWIPPLIVGVYTAFVATCMWNWFAVRALNVPSISFLEMVGLVWLIGILIHRPNTDEGKWKMLYTAIDACVPDHKREMLSEALREQTNNIWIDVLTISFAQIVGNTTTLILGFGLHSLIG